MRSEAGQFAAAVSCAGPDTAAVTRGQAATRAAMVQMGNVPACGSPADTQRQFAEEASLSSLKKLESLQAEHDAAIAALDWARIDSANHAFHRFINTHGGNLNEAYIIGMTHIVEGVEQVRGTAINQVKDTEFALVSGGPASLPVSSLILRSA